MGTEAPLLCLQIPVIAAQTEVHVSVQQCAAPTTTTLNDDDDDDIFYG